VITVPMYLVELDTERRLAHFSADVRVTCVAIPLSRESMGELAGREGKLFELRLEESAPGPGSVGI